MCSQKKPLITLGIRIWGVKESIEGAEFLSSGSLPVCYTKSAFTWKVWCWQLQVPSVPTVGVCSISSVVKEAGRALQRKHCFHSDFSFEPPLLYEHKADWLKSSAMKYCSFFCVGEKWGRKITLFYRQFYGYHLAMQRKTVRLRFFFSICCETSRFF